MWLMRQGVKREFVVLLSLHSKEEAKIQKQPQIFILYFSRSPLVEYSVFQCLMEWKIVKVELNLWPFA